MCSHFLFALYSNFQINWDQMRANGDIGSCFADVSSKSHEISLIILFLDSNQVKCTTKGVSSKVQFTNKIYFTCNFLDSNTMKWELLPFAQLKNCVNFFFENWAIFFMKSGVFITCFWCNTSKCSEKLGNIAQWYLTIHSKYLQKSAWTQKSNDLSCYSHYSSINLLYANYWLVCVYFSCRAKSSNSYLI